MLPGSWAYTVLGFTAGSKVSCHVDNWWVLVFTIPRWPAATEVWSGVVCMVHVSLFVSRKWEMKTKQRASPPVAMALR